MKIGSFMKWTGRYHVEGTDCDGEPINYWVETQDEHDLFNQIGTLDLPYIEMLRNNYNLEAIKNPKMGYSRLYNVTQQVISLREAELKREEEELQTKMADAEVVDAEVAEQQLTIGGMTTETIFSFAAQFIGGWILGDVIHHKLGEVYGWTDLHDYKK